MHCFPVSSVLLAPASESVGLGWGLGKCTSKNVPGDANAVCGEPHFDEGSRFHAPETFSI